jgi:photosystem II stability/assembly factor-like uncharacterized protein
MPTMKRFMTSCVLVLLGLEASSYATAQEITRKTTWESISILKPRFEEKFYRIAFVNRDVGYMASNQAIWKTTDGCKTWKSVLQATFLRESPVTTLHFKDARHGWLVSSEKFYSSDDGGESWAPEDVEYVHAVAFGPDNWMLTGGSKRLNQRRGSTGSWEPVKGKGPLPGITFNDGVVYLAIGDAKTAFVGIDGTEARVIRTVDGGKHWDVVFKKGFQISSLNFADAKRGWVTAGSSIYATRDGGETWKRQLNPEDRQIVTVAFDPAGSGTAVAPLQTESGQNRKILISSDGQKWHSVELDLDSGEFVDAAVVDAGLGYVLMDDGHFISLLNDRKK